MTAFNILEQAVLIAGGTVPDELLKKTGVSLINTILSDMGEPLISSLADELHFSHQGYYTAVSTGVAMLLAVMWGDDAGNARLCEVYNSVRNRLLGRVTRVKTTLFGGDRYEIQ